MVKRSTWARNFGKSIKFGAKEVASEIAPSISNTFSSSNLDIVKSLRDIKNFNRLIGTTLLGDETYERFLKYGGEALKNAKRDLKQGTFIKESKDDMGFGDMDEDWGFDDTEDFDDNFDSSDDDSSDNDRPVVINNELPRHQIAELQQGINTQSLVMSKGFASLAATNKQLISANIAISHDLGNRQLSYLDDINKNLVSIVEFNNETMSKFAMASMKYYDDSLAQLTKLMEEGIGPGRLKEKEAKEYQATDYELLFNSEGAIDLNGLKTVISKNVRRTFQNSILGSFVGMLDNDMILESFAKNPLSFIITNTIQSAIPKLIKNSIMGLDKSFKEFFPALMSKFTKMGENSESPLMSILGSIFGIQSSTGVDVDLSRYEKGAIPFDGMTKKSIVEVIPTYLRKILSAVSGREEMAFDYEKGVFKSLQSMKKERDNEERNEYLNEFFPIKNSISDFADEHIQFNSKYEREKFDKKIDDFLVNIGKAGGGFNVRKLEDYMDAGLDEYSAKLVQSIVTNLDHSLQMAMSGSMPLRARMYIESKRNDRAENGDLSLISNYLGNGMQDELDIDRLSIDKDYYTYNHPLYHRALASAESNGVKRWLKSGDNEYHSQKDIQQKIDELNEYQRREYSEEERSKDKLKYDGDTPIDSATVGALMMSDKMKRDESLHKKDTGFWSSITKYFDKPQQLLIDAIQHIDNTLYNIIFGTEGNESLLSATINQIKTTFTNFREWMKENIYNPLKRFLFGEDFTKSKIYLAGKAGIASFQNFIFGTKGEDGKYSGGLISDTANELKKMFSFSGDKKDKDSHGLLDYVKDDIKSIGNRMERYIFGDKDETKEEEKRPLVDRIFDGFGKGFNNFKNFFLGTKFDTPEQQKQASQEFTNSLKAKLPKAVATGILGAGVTTAVGLSGGWGLMGGMLLPTGPIGGMLLGTALGFARQSDSFNKFVFGDEATGKEGIVPAKFVNWWNKNKTAIIGGAALGAIKGLFGFSVLPSALEFIPGVGIANGILATTLGPVLGGVGLALAYKSNAMQRLLFGKDEIGADGKKITGILNGKMATKMKDMLPNMAVGALGMNLASGVIGEMGVLGSLAVSGPIPASILGAAAGIAIGSEKFNKFLFGEIDENGNVKGGMYDKLSNYISTELWKPFKLKAERYGFEMAKWFNQSVINPLDKAFTPIRVAMTDVAKSIGGYVQRMFSNVGKSILSLISPLRNGIFDVFNWILDKGKTIFDTTFRLLGKFTKFGVQAAVMPITIAGAMASGGEKMISWKQGISNAASVLGGTMLSRDAGLMDRFRAIGSLGGAIVNPWDIWENDPSVSQILANDERVSKRARRQAIKYGLKEADLSRREREYKEYQKQMRLRGYSSSDEDLKRKFDERQKALKATDEVKVKTVQESLLKAGNITSESIKNDTADISTNTKEILEVIKGNGTNILTGAADGVKLDANGKVDFNNIKAGNITGSGISTNTFTSNIGNLGGTGKIGFDSSDNELSAQKVNEKKKEERSREEAVEAAKSTAASFKEFLYGKANKFKDGIFGTLRGGFETIKSLVNLGSLFSPLAIGGALVSLYKMLNGGLDANGSGIGQDSRTDRLFAQFEKAGVRLGAKGIQYGMKVGEAISSHYTQAKDVVRGAGIITKDAVTSLKNKIVNKKNGAKVGEIITSEMDKAGKVTENVIPNPKEFTEKVTGVINKALESQFVQKVLGASWVAKAKKFLLGLVAKLTAPAAWKGFIATCGKHAFTLGKASVGLLAGPIGFALFAAYDGITGFANAAELFRVDEDSVDMKMRCISGVVKMLFGIPLLPVALFDLGMTFLSQFLGWDFDHRTYVAMQLYEFVSSDEDYKTLVQAQNNLNKEYESFLASNKQTRDDYTYQQYIDDRFNNTDTDMGKRVAQHRKNISMMAKRESQNESTGFFDRIINRSVQTHMDQYSNLFAGGSGYAPSTVMISRGDRGMKYYNQNDPRWSNLPLSPDNKDYSTIGEAGCAPTSMAMVVSQLTGKNFDPEDAAKDITDRDLNHPWLGMGEKGVVANIDNDYFTRESKKHGLVQHQITQDSDLQAILANGGVTILGGSSYNRYSPLYGSGHYVVAAGLAPSNPDYALVYNPNGDNKEYPISELMNETVYNNGFASYFTTSPYAVQGHLNSVVMNKAAANIGPVASDYVDKGKQVVDRARDYISTQTPYVLGGPGGEPGQPTDCGKFISDVFSDCGIIIANGARYVPAIYDWFYKIGAVESKNAKPEPGDIVIWNSSSSSGGQGGDCAHIGICTGDGKGVIHASGTRGVVEDTSYQWGSPWSVKCICKFKVISGGFSASEYAKHKANSRRKASLSDVFNRFHDMAKSFFLAKISGQEFSFDEWAAAHPFDSENNNPTTYIQSKLLPEEQRANQIKVWEYLTKKKGYSRQVASAIMANMMGESGFNPTAVGDGGSSLGLVQWHDTRKDALINFARERGKEATDIDAQLDFLSHELDTIYGTTIHKMNSANSLREATRIFIDEFERPLSPDKELAKRLPYAQGVYDDRNTFVGGANAKGLITSILSNEISRMYKRMNAKKKTSVPDNQLNTIKSDSNYTATNNTPIILKSAKNITSSSNSTFSSIDLNTITSSLKKLDIHDELVEVISYLKVISEKIGTETNNTIIVQDSAKAKSGDRSAYRVTNKDRKRVNPSILDKIGEGLFDKLNSSSPSNAEIALAISSGKPLYEGK